MKIVLLMGTSGSGKNYHQQKILESDLNFTSIMSATTRKPREGEIDGIDYLFLSKEKFNLTEMVEQEEFSGNNYGTPLSQFTNISANLVKVIEPIGAMNMIEYIKARNIQIEIVPIFLNLPTNIVVSHMRKRGDTDKMIVNRLIQDDILERFYKAKIEAKIVTELDFDIVQYLKTYAKE